MKKLLLLLLIMPNLVMAEAYLCITEASGGVKYDSVTKKYSGTAFSNDSKYIIKKEEDQWTFSTFGKETTIAFCKEAVYGEKPSLGVGCDVWGGDFYFNFEGLRFYKTYDLLRYTFYDSEDSTPMIEVGFCSKI